MTLKKYTSKRNLEESKEPAGGSKTKGSLRFVIQKHAARRLHYDLRLEYKGVLLSWAVPKGPSLNPADKRLAIQVEDHPLDYQYFEGTIPKGNYGAGTVEIWDKGTYTTPEYSAPKEIEKYLKAGLEKGHFSVIFHGERLHGEFSFIKLHQKENEWLLIKKDDAYGTPEETIPAKKKALEKKVRMPDFVAPMLATLIDAPFNDPDWLFEIKWDGYRALAFVKKGKAQLKSRSNIIWGEKFAPIVRALEKSKEDVILDGEAVVLDAQGKSNFQLMQNYQKEGVGNLCYYVFDILYKDGQDLRSLPLTERKEILKAFLDKLKSSVVLYSDHVVGKGEAFFKAAAKKDLEGIIGKNMASTYQSKRSRDWVKIKTHMRQEVVIGGFTEPRGSRKKFGALLVGVYDDDQELIYSGHVGGGFNGQLLEDVYKKLKPLIQKTSPFKTKIAANAPVTWVKPKLVCEVSFAEWTSGGIMRQPIFQGLRMDKKPKAVIKEVPKKKENAELTNLDKIYWPKQKYTKGDLIAYYQEVGPYMLPYLKNRPIVLHRYPNGIEGTQFYQKDLETHPDWIETVPVKHEEKIIHYLLINNLRSLLYAVNLGSIDIHPFMATLDDLENPSYCVIDLDPHDLPFSKTIEAAKTLHEMLEEWKVKHYCKTSGGNGLHFVIPLRGKYDFEQSRQFAEIIGFHLHNKLPRTTSLERNPKKRPKKIYIDCLQNRIGQTIVAPYSVRPRPLALVSTPIEWDELDGLDIAKFTMESVPKRLKKKGDIFKPILGAGVDIKKILKSLN